MHLMVSGAGTYLQPHLNQELVCVHFASPSILSVCCWGLSARKMFFFFDLGDLSELGVCRRQLSYSDLAVGGRGLSPTECNESGMADVNILSVPPQKAPLSR